MQDNPLARLDQFGIAADMLAPLFLVIDSDILGHGPSKALKSLARTHCAVEVCRAANCLGWLGKLGWRRRGRPCSSAETCGKDAKYRGTSPPAINVISGFGPEVRGFIYVSDLADHAFQGDGNWLDGER